MLVDLALRCLCLLVAKEPFTALLCLTQTAANAAAYLPQYTICPKLDQNGGKLLLVSSFFVYWLNGGRDGMMLAVHSKPRERGRERENKKAGGENQRECNVVEGCFLREGLQTAVFSFHFFVLGDIARYRYCCYAAGHAQ